MSRRHGPSHLHFEDQYHPSYRQDEGYSTEANHSPSWPFSVATQTDILSASSTLPPPRRKAWRDSYYSAPPQPQTTSSTPSWPPSPAAASAAHDNHVSGDIPPGPMRKARGAAVAERPSVSAELALRGLYDTLRSSLAFFRNYQETFDGQVGQLASWVPEATLDELWRNMVQDRFREAGQAEQFEEAGEKIADRLQPLRHVAAQGAAAAALSVATGGSGKAGSSKAGYILERRSRAAGKAVVVCEGIVDLARRAQGERTACAFLVEELRDAAGLLDPDTHPGLHGEGETAAKAQQEPTQDSKSKGQSVEPSAKPSAKPSAGGESEADKPAQDNGGASGWE